MSVPHDSSSRKWKPVEARMECIQSTLVHLTGIAHQMPCLLGGFDFRVTVYSMSWKKCEHVCITELMIVWVLLPLSKLDSEVSCVRHSACTLNNLKDRHSLNHRPNAKLPLLALVVGIRVNPAN